MTDVSPIQESINFEEAFKYTALKLGFDEPTVRCYVTSDQAAFCVVNGNTYRITKPWTSTKLKNEVKKILDT